MGALSVIWMVLRRMLTQWRMELCLFFGLLAATGVVTAVPIYTSGALQNTFQKDWKANTEELKTPGTYSVNIDYTQTRWYEREWDKLSNANNNKSNAEQNKENRVFAAKLVGQVLKAHQYIQKNVPLNLHVPLRASTWSVSLNDSLVLPPPADDPEAYMTLEVYTMTGFESLVRIEEGRMPRARVGSNRIVEVICPVSLADRNNLVVGHLYPMSCQSIGFSSDDNLKSTIKLRLVGTFTIKPKTKNSPAWQTSADVDNGLYMDPQAFLTLLQKYHVYPSNFYETWVMDYRKIHLTHLPGLISALLKLNHGYLKFEGLMTTGDTPIDFFKEFAAKQRALRLMMLVLALPTILLILYYVALAAGLIIDQRRGEIAMLRSRGAGAWQLTASIILEWLTLGVGCLLFGPPIGLVIAQIFGSSSGFLSFVDRKALPVHLTAESYLYALAIVFLMVVAAAIPSIKAARHSIVSYKQERSRTRSKPFWQKYFLDLVLFAIGIYGYRTMTLQNNATTQTPGGFEQLVDPFLFIVPTLIVLAAGLILLRLLPLINLILEKLLSRGKGVALYASFMEASRNPQKYRPLMLLVILTIATGIYGAAMARSLDQNMQDQTYYSIGADAVLEERWFRPVGQFAMAPFEPPFLIHNNMPGVVSAARVLIDKEAQVAKDRSVITAMAFNPLEFYRTAWFRQNLIPHRLGNYLNMMAKYPNGIIISEQLMANQDLKPGDSITLILNKAKIDFVILGAVKYWPTMYDGKAPFALANLDYIIHQSTVYPYQDWLKLAPGAKLATGLNYLQKQGIRVLRVSDARSEIALARRNPQKMGFYGIISVGFCVAVIIMVIGFLLYTFISLQSRLLQFGVLRAVGLSLRQLVQMLCLEQLWSVGIGLLAGTLIGEVISMIFVPFLQSSAGFSSTVPPFSVIISGKDIWSIYEAILPILFISLVILAYILARLQVHQAVKLGEEG